MPGVGKPGVGVTRGFCVGTATMGVLVVDVVAPTSAGDGIKMAGGVGNPVPGVTAGLGVGTAMMGVLIVDVVASRAGDGGMTKPGVGKPPGLGVTTGFSVGTATTGVLVVPPVVGALGVGILKVGCDETVDEGLGVGKGNAVVDVGCWLAGLGVDASGVVGGFDVAVVAAAGVGVGTDSAGE